MIRCLDCHRQLKDPLSKLLQRGPGCRAKHETVVKNNRRAKRPGNADQPSLFDEPLSIQEAMKGGPWENLEDEIDFDALRGRVADSEKVE